MKTTILILILIATFHLSYAQSYRTTGGDELGGIITSITPCDTPGIILTKGQSYVLNFEITYMNYDTSKENFYVVVDSSSWLSIYDSSVVIGKIENIHLSFTALPYYGSISINNLSLNEGLHTFYLYHPWQTIDSKIVTIRMATGIMQVDENANYTLYPNPTSGKMTINTNEDGQLNVTNVFGQEIASYRISTRNANLQLPLSLTPGIYFAKFMPNNGNSIKVTRLVFKP